MKLVFYTSNIDIQKIRLFIGVAKKKMANTTGNGSQVNLTRVYANVHWFSIPITNIKEYVTQALANSTKITIKVKGGKKIKINLYPTIRMQTLNVTLISCLYKYYEIDIYVVSRWD